MPPTIREAAAAIRRGEVTPLGLLDACLERIDRLEGKVRAWVLVDRDGAREQARRLTEELRRGSDRGPLHGIPVGVKDIFDVYDQPTAAGSARWAGAVARRDGTAVARLRAAGAVIVGKTVTAAFAGFDPPVTRNPWDLSHYPGGSSSGSAAAVACGMCLGALGSQTGGSVTRPAAYCGVCGMKPTFGRVSTDGVVPVAPSLDHVGVMANAVEDLALLTQAVAGPDPRDPLCARRPVPPLLPPDGGGAGRLPNPVRVAVLTGMFAEKAGPETRAMIESVGAALAAGGGVELRSVQPPPGFADVLAHHRRIMAVEAAAYHAPRFRARPDDYPPLFREMIEEGLATAAVDYADSKRHQRALRRQCDLLLRAFDVLLTPAATGPAPRERSTGDPSFNSPWSYTGLPTISLPAARTAGGLPLAVQLVGRRWGEAELVAVARLVESRIGFERREVLID